MKVEKTGSFLSRDGRAIEVKEIKPTGIFRVYGTLAGKDERWTVEGRLFIKRESGGDIWKSL